MADYITKIEGKEILSQAYSRLDISYLHNKEQRENLERLLKSYIEPRAKFIFGEDVEVVIDFQEGSLITNITVWGTAAAIILSPFANYKDIKENLGELKTDVYEIFSDDENLSKAKKSIRDYSDDASRLAQATNLEVMFSTGARACNKIRMEKRNGVLGRADYLIKIVNGISHDYRVISKEDITTSSNTMISGLYTRTAKFRNELNSIFAKLEDPNSKACFAAIMLKEFEKFPNNHPASKRIAEDVDVFIRKNQYSEAEEEMIFLNDYLGRLFSEFAYIKNICVQYLPTLKPEAT